MGEVKRCYYNPTIETMPRDQMQKLQFKRLKYQLNYLYNNNPFYRKLWDEHNVQLNSINSIEDFRRMVPLVEKKDFLRDQEEHPPYGLRLGIPPEKIVQIFTTSGTSGIGQEIYGHTWSDTFRCGSRHMESSFYIAGIRKGDVVYNLTPVDRQLLMGLTSIETARLGSWNAMHVFGFDSQTKVRFMKKVPPHGISATSIHMARLTQICMENGIDPRRDFPTLKAIFIAGQSYPVEMGQRIEEFWGVKLYDTYGSSQGSGPMAGTCERGALYNGQRGLMHIFEYAVIMEVVDPKTNEHVRDGEEGMAVISVLDVAGSPVIRFATNDKVRYFEHGACSCGRPFASIEAGTISRYDDMLKIKGINIWPQTIDDVIFGYEEVAEYIASVGVNQETNLEEAEIRFAFRPDLLSTMGPEKRGNIRSRITAQIKEKTLLGMKVVEVPRSEIPVFEFKAPRWTDTRLRDLAKG